MCPAPDYQPPGRDTARRQGRNARFRRNYSRLDRFVGMLERVGRSLWIALIVVGVALGSAAVFIMVNKPDDKEALALVAALEEGAVPVARYASDNWTHVCLGETGIDGRDLLRDIAGLEVQACSGWNQSFMFYDSYAALAFGSATACHVIPVNAELFVPAPAGEARCVERRGLMMLEFDGQGATRRLTVRRR